jgi:hypothetical protein
MEDLATHLIPAHAEADDPVLEICPVRRGDISPLHLLKAEDLPAAGSVVRRTMSQDTADALCTVLDTDSHGTAPKLLAAVDAALDCLPPAGDATKYTSEEQQTLPSDLYEEHDLFFGAIRVTGNPVEVFTRTLLEALRSQLNDAVSAGVGLGAAEWSQLLDSFRSTFSLLWRVGVAGTDFEAGTKPRASADEVRAESVGVDPLVRWRLGHQVFFALIQALIVAVGCLSETLDETPDDTEGARRLIEDATVLMIGSGASLSYAGDFTRGLYADVVRPAMLPPHINAKFSGLQLRDHRMLLRQLNQVKPLLTTSEPTVRASYGQLLDAMSTAYEAHVMVCSRFGGDREPSLRTPGSKVPAADVLERFRTQRVEAATPESSTD